LDWELAQLENGACDLLERFTAASTWVRGKRVNVPEQGGYTGVTAGLDAHGFLRVMDDSGTLRTVLSGGVREAD
jgi:BirA family biotin operon repressor/biotin-[acetyl-CoA-carboxylase] ligase